MLSSLLLLSKWVRVIAHAMAEELETVHDYDCDLSSVRQVQAGKYSPPK